MVDDSDPSDSDRARVDSELLATLLATTPDFVYFKDTERRFVRVSKTMETLFGLPEAEIIGKRDEDLFPEHIHIHSVPDDIRVLTTGEPIVNKLEGGEVRAGTQTWVLTNKTLWRSASGEVQGLHGTSREFTDLKRLRDSERRAKQILSQIHDSVISVDLEGFITSWNHGSEVLFGHSAEAMLGRHISVVYPEEDHGLLETDIIAPLLRQGEHHAEVRLLRASGDVFYGHLALSVLTEDGKPSGMIGYTMDITERVEGEKRRKLLMRELDHRVKNSLAVVRSLARQTANRAPTLDAFLQQFSGRLDAMVVAHETLAGNRWTGLPLRQAVSEALTSSDGVTADGPDVILPPECATPLCLALHELTTNARKHGALQQADGSVDLRWSWQADEVEIRWREHGCKEPPSNLKPGFGLSLVHGLIEHEAGGRFSLEMTPEGLSATIHLPTREDRSASLGPGAR